MAYFDGVHAFGYNSAKSELIWMKSGALWLHAARCLGLAVADFGRGLCSSNGWGARQIFFYQVSNARFYPFSFNHISRNLNTTRRSVSRWILWEQNFTARHHTDFVSEHGLMTSSGHAHKSFNNITGNWVTDLHMTPIWWYAAASWKFLKTQCSSANKFSISLFRNDVWS